MTLVSVFERNMGKNIFYSLYDGYLFKTFPREPDRSGGDIGISFRDSVLLLCKEKIVILSNVRN